MDHITQFALAHWPLLTLLSIGAYGIAMVFSAAVWALARRYTPR